MTESFHKLARETAAVVGRPKSFFLAVSVILVWAVSGPLFHFSDTWQLVINTGTTIVTFLMVFLIQNTQNRDAQAIHLKLDELLRATHAARNRLVDLENTTECRAERSAGRISQAARGGLRGDAGDCAGEERRQAPQVVV